VISPLLSNVVLDELDRELERRGHRHVRYADDCNIYVRSERAGHRVMKSITRFITQRLKLQVNETKSAVARPQERKFLGFSFTNNPGTRRAIAPKALERFKDKIRKITRQAKGVSIETTVKRLATYMVGMARLLQLLRNPRGADRPYSLGAAQAAMRTLATVEDSTPSSGCVAATRSASTSGRSYGWQWARSLVPGPRQSSLRGSFKCLLPLARLTFTVRELLAQPLEPPCTDPFARWCGRGRQVTAAPMPIKRDFE
jgi:hypothetical protein